MRAWVLAAKAALAGRLAPPSRGGVPSDAPSDPPEARAARLALIAAIAKRERMRPEVRRALEETPRHLFVDGPVERAYLDAPLPIGWEQTISQPTVVAMMSEALDLHGTESVLEIGTGSAYQAAVLSRLAARVDSIEIVPVLADQARERLARLGYLNVQVRLGDGYAGWKERAPYDRIVLTAAPPELPGELLEQLTEDGILVAPVGDEGRQRLSVWRKRGDVGADLGPVRFVPMVHAPSAPPVAGST